jgi:hypothetical protein
MEGKKTHHLKEGVGSFVIFNILINPILPGIWRKAYSPP